MKEKPDEKAHSEEPGQDGRPEINSNKDLLIYFYLQIKQYGKWWLLPMWLVLAFLALFVSLSGNTSILPAIYALF